MSLARSFEVHRRTDPDTKVGGIAESLCKGVQIILKRLELDARDHGSRTPPRHCEFSIPQLWIFQQGTVVTTVAIASGAGRIDRWRAGFGMRGCLSFVDRVEWFLGVDWIVEALDSADSPGGTRIAAPRCSGSSTLRTLPFHWPPRPFGLREKVPFYGRAPHSGVHSSLSALCLRAKGPVGLARLLGRAGCRNDRDLTIEECQQLRRRCCSDRLVAQIVPRIHRPSTSLRIVTKRPTLTCDRRTHKPGLPAPTVGRSRLSRVCTTRVLLHELRTASHPTMW